MKPTTFLVTLIAVAIFAFSCKKTTGGSLSFPSNVYVAGAVYDTFTKVYNAYYWNNGNIVLLNDGFNTTSSAIFVDANDIYVAGYYYDSIHAANFPCYWKNNIRVNLSTSSGQTTDILVTNNNVYVSGWLNDSFQSPHPVYWLNGNLHYLSTEVGYNNSICLNGSDIFMGGAIDYNATIWKNGTLCFNEPFSGGINTLINDVAVLSNDIYATGYEVLINHRDAVIWKNGVKTTLNSTGQQGVGNNIFITNNDVYVSGIEYPDVPTPSIRYAKVWKNNMPVIFQNTESGDAIASAQFNNSVYTIGYSDTYSYKPVIWVNGSVMKISNQDGYSNSIFIK